MANAALFVGFGQPARARERQALALLNRALALYASLQQRGEIESFEHVLLDPHGGDLSGFILIRGEREQLQRLREHDEFRATNARATLVVEGFGVVDAYVGESFDAQLAVYQQELEEQLSA